VTPLRTLRRDAACVFPAPGARSDYAVRTQAAARIRRVNNAESVSSHFMPLRSFTRMNRTWPAQRLCDLEKCAVGLSHSTFPVHWLGSSSASTITTTEVCESLSGWGVAWSSQLAHRGVGRDGPRAGASAEPTQAAPSCALTSSIDCPDPRIALRGGGALRCAALHTKRRRLLVCSARSDMGQGAWLLWPERRALTHIIIP